jgi:hypothetical protein
MVYFTTCASLPVFRNRGDLERAPFSVRMGTFTAILCLALIVWLMTQVDYSREGMPVIAAALAGFALYAVVRATRRFGETKVS